MIVQDLRRYFRDNYKISLVKFKLGINKPRFKGHPALAHHMGKVENSNPPEDVILLKYTQNLDDFHLDSTIILFESGKIKKVSRFDIADSPILVTRFDSFLNIKIKDFKGSSTIFGPGNKVTKESIVGREFKPGEYSILNGISPRLENNLTYFVSVKIDENISLKFLLEDITFLLPDLTKIVFPKDRSIKEGDIVTHRKLNITGRVTRVKMCLDSKKVKNSRNSQKDIVYFNTTDTKGEVKSHYTYFKNLKKHDIIKKK